MDLGDFSATIGSFFASYFQGMESVIELAKAAPSDASLTSFPAGTLWNAAQSVSNSIALGIASTLIALFLMFELISLFNRSDTKGWDGIYWILMAFLKVAIAITVCKNMSLIIGICFQIAAEAVNGIERAGLLNTQMKTSLDLASDIEAAFKDAGFGKNMWGVIAGSLTKIVSDFSLVLAQIVCKLRFIEIYVLTAIAPLPFCTLVSKDYKHIGISFIKRLVALGLQGLFIMIVCFMYMEIVNFSVDGIVVDQADPTAVMFQLAGYSILLIIAIFQTGGWAKSLLQVN